MVVIRLARGGSKKRPYYYIVAADKRSPRDGRYIERVGFFNPIARGQQQKLDFVRERINHWVENGAQMSERVRDLLKQWDKQQAAA